MTSQFFYFFFFCEQNILGSVWGFTQGNSNYWKKCGGTELSVAFYLIEWQINLPIHFISHIYITNILFFTILIFL